MTTSEATPTTTTFEQSARAQSRLHRLVPGGAHTDVRGSGDYPPGMAPVLVRGRDARVLDVDGNWFVEYGMGLHSVTLGHGYGPVTAAVARAACDGVSFTRPTVWELRAAERFLQMVPGADMVEFAGSGADTTTAAVRLARLGTGRDLVAVCLDQPVVPVDDGFLGTTPVTAGTAGRQAPVVGFRYNDLASVEGLLAAHPGRVACLVLEAATATAEPAPGFLEGLRALADRDGFVLVFDETTTGLRWAAGGAQGVYGVTPDLSTWGRGLGNGFAISALAGRRDLMELCGPDTGASRAVPLSTTHGPEVTGLAAYLAVADAYEQRDVVGVMERQGAVLAEAVNKAAADAGLAEHVACVGRPSCLVFTIRDADGAPSRPFRTLFLQEMLRRGVLGQSFVVSAAHTDDDLDLTVAAVRGALEVYRRALEGGATDGFLQGRPVAPAPREHAAPRRRPVTEPT